ARRDLAVTHVTAHALALVDLARERAAPDGARPAVEARAVRRAAAAEVVAEHDALEALALRGAGHADLLDALEDAQVEELAQLRQRVHLERLELLEHAL